MCKSFEEIEKVLNSYKKEQENIEKSIIEVLSYMRGSLTWDEIWLLTTKNILNIKNQIKKNIEIFSKTGYNF